MADLNLPLPISDALSSAERDAERIRAELRELRRLVDRLHDSASDAQRRNDLLKGILDLLPVGLTVQDEFGSFVLVNDVAATWLDASPIASYAETNSRKGGASSTVEESSSGTAGERTWLTSRKPVRVLDETLLLSASLDITERKQFETDLARRAYSDDLTGLANRAMIQEHVGHVLRTKGDSERFALAFIDLDNFKHINDYYSHAVGDALLVKVAQRIAALVRETDLLARISGDEFVLLVDPIESDEHVQGVIECLLEKLKEPFHIEGFEVFTSASIGVSKYPEHGRDYEALRRNADSAMYRAKSGAKGAAAFFDVKMGESVTARWSWSSGSGSPSATASSAAPSSPRSTFAARRWWDSRR